MGSAIGFCPAGRERIVSENPISPPSNHDAGRVGVECVIPSEEVGGNAIEKGEKIGVDKWILGPVVTRETGDEEDNHEEQDVRTPKLPREPGMPTQRERDEHACTHWPTRPWCKHCMRGKGVASPHRSATPAERELRAEGVPTISVDHCFLGSERDAEDHKERPFLIMHDSKSEAIY